MWTPERKVSGRVTSKGQRPLGPAGGGGGEARVGEELRSLLEGLGQGGPGGAEQRRHTVRPGGSLCCCDGEGPQRGENRSLRPS